MEAEVKNNVTTKQTNHHRQEKKKCTVCFLLKAKLYTAPLFLNSSWSIILKLLFSNQNRGRNICIQE